MTAQSEVSEVLPRPRSLSEVNGWFRAVDQTLFDWFLTYQKERGQQGDLLELGAYLGKSAILLAHHLGESERFTVCDLFDSPAPDDHNSRENDKSYATLTRRGFEANYLSFHPELPTIIQAPTSVVTDEVAAHSCRFVHVDASHLYEHVRGDVIATRELATPDAVVSFDDYRSPHCPGVAAAVWEAVANEKFNPVCVTEKKLYGTWGDPEPLRAALLAWLGTRSDLPYEVQQVMGHSLVRVDGGKAKAPKLPVSKWKALPAPAKGAAQPAGAKPAAKSAAPRTTWRKLAKDLLPPLVTRAIVAQRARRRAAR
ncbi:class I SAM-dependent methyltransferase [Streptomyces indicus]|uniref:Methyltransferase domain-containing protein n=1 Tax=Streptomyces indicus TaxID=417292 RepID=A0A1G9FFH2_9ACTN|nr:class I SAM-dependent methyltransferase [Streptomyces indicus]SDK87102.1 Methyltransferase domain-containing protein [Streptomyces indicus]